MESDFMIIRQMPLDTGKYSLKSPYTMNPQGYCIHNTANNASANNEVAYMNRNDQSTSFHYAIDDIEVVQAIPESRNAFHALDGNGIGNRGHIAIEICYSTGDMDKFSKSEENCAKFLATRLRERGWGIDRVKKHQDFSGKYCPHKTLDLGWERFLNLVREQMDIPQEPSQIPTPPPKPQESVFEKAKRYNTPKCRELQDKLNRAGYNCGAIDGIYGNNTHNALGKFQKENHLSVDYLAGKQTFAKLDEKINTPKPNGNDWVRRLQSELNSQGFRDSNGNKLIVDGLVGNLTISACPTLKEGARGNITRLLQEKLVSLSYNTNGIDGKFGGGTKGAVIKFQGNKGLGSDGIVGRNTWRSLLNS